MITSGVYELYYYDLSETSSIVSIGITITIILLSIVGITFIFYFARYSANSNFSSEDSYFKELIDGFKPSKLAKMYFAIFILRRLLSVLLTI